MAITNRLQADQQAVNPIGIASFKLAKSFTPIYTGGSLALTNDGQRLYTTLNENVVLTDVASGERLHLFSGVSQIWATRERLVQQD